MAGSNPYSRQQTLQHPLARMLPLQREQEMVYRLGEKHPPSAGMENHSPMWEAISFSLAAQSTLQARVNLQRDFVLLAMTSSSSSVANGGFRAQLYDTKKKLRLADRGVRRALIAGQAGAAFFLREPYHFDQSDSQVLVLVQNLETVTNNIQISLYGQVLRFNESSPSSPVLPGGSLSSDAIDTFRGAVTTFEEIGSLL